MQRNDSKVKKIVPPIVSLSVRNLISHEKAIKKRTQSGDEDEFKAPKSSERRSNQQTERVQSK
jgi:hypothetical protein